MFCVLFRLQYAGVSFDKQWCGRNRSRLFDESDQSVKTGLSVGLAPQSACDPRVAAGSLVACTTLCLLYVVNGLRLAAKLATRLAGGVNRVTNKALTASNETCKNPRTPTPKGHTHLAAIVVEVNATYARCLLL